MAYKFNQRGKSPITMNIVFLLFFALGCLLLIALDLRAQSPQASPSPSNENNTVTFSGYDVTSSFEVGVRGVSVNGNDNKYRSDFNYRPGFRVFDSSLLMKRQEGKGGLFDSLLITSSGWNADPSGFTRINMEKAGAYRFDANIRQVVYFNNLRTHARNGHTANTRRNFGDFDLTVFPESENFRLRFGAGYNRNKGTGSITSRAYSDEFPVPSLVDSRTTEFRAGVDGKLLGFNLSVGYGYRRFNDNTNYLISTLEPGYTNATTVISTFNRLYPIKGDTHYTTFNAQRTFAKKLDFTARIIYSSSVSKFEFLESITGRDNNNNFVDSDTFNIGGDSKRPQTRGDLGLTYAVTDNFRISNTFTFEHFNIGGGGPYGNVLIRRNAVGNPLAPSITNRVYHRDTRFKRYANTVEGDYQFNDRFGVHFGYRYTHRKIDLGGFNLTTTSTITNTSNICSLTINPAIICEEEENTTNTFIAGFKAKPMKRWVIFGDLETGEADNAFTRLANYNVTNLRLRSRWSFNRFAINVSAITKDNENPSLSTAPQGNVTGDFIANTKSRIFSVFVDWTPIDRFSLSSGYTYQHLTSETDIVINTGALVRGFSQFYIRDHHVFFDVSAQPFNRVSFFASYRYNNDRGQGNRVPAASNILVTSYPFKLFTAESRIAIRLTKNIDWNIGYQYIGYNDRFRVDPLLWVYSPQDYHANLPYTSLRIYLGRGER